MGGDNKSTQLAKQQIQAIRDFLGPYANALDLSKLNQIIASGGAGGAVLPLDTATSMARNQAATIGNNEAVNANRQALQREGPQVSYSNLPGSPTKAFADTIAQNVAAAGNETALNQQNLQLENFKSAISPISSIIQTLFGGYSGVSESGVSNANFSPLFGNGGAFNAIASLAPTSSFKAFSDRRLKSDIEKIGKIGALNVYKYKIGDKDEKGVMAQEARVLFPEAVDEHPSGYLMVNYRKLKELVAHA